MEPQGENEKKQSDWTVLDGKFLSFVIFAPPIIYFVPWILFGINAPFIRSVKTAERLVPKLTKDVEFVTECCSAEGAREFALFFANFTLVTMVLTIIAIIVRLAFFGKEPHSFINRVKPEHKKYLPIYLVVLVIVVFFMPVVFVSADKIRYESFPPGPRPYAVSSILIMMTGIMFYNSTVAFFTGGLRGAFSRNIKTIQKNGERDDTGSHPHEQGPHS